MSAQQRLLIPLTKDNLDELKKQAPEVIMVHLQLKLIKFLWSL
jgi:hypothetical protein